MSDDWAPGDLALCIHVGRWRYFDGVFASGPKAGAILTVRAIGHHPEDGLALWFLEWPGDEWGNAFESSSFRKVTPPEADEFDRETIALLTGRPVKEPA